MASKQKYYPNRTYKIFSIYNEIFNACLSIFERDRLRDYFIQNFFYYENISELPNYNKPELFFAMMNDLEELHKDLPGLRDTINLKSDRISELQDIYQKHTGHIYSNKRIVFNIRIPDDTVEFITGIAEETETIGEVIEIAISHFINNCKEQDYKLIKFAFELNLKDE